MGIEQRDGPRVDLHQRSHLKLGEGEEKHDCERGSCATQTTCTDQENTVVELRGSGSESLTMDRFGRDRSGCEIKQDCGDGCEFPKQQRRVENRVDRRMMDQGQREVRVGVTGQQDRSQIRRKQERSRQSSNRGAWIGQERTNRMCCCDCEKCDGEAPEKSH